MQYDSSCEIKASKNSCSNGIRTDDLCDTGTVLYQLSYPTVWELVTLLVRNIHKAARKSYSGQTGNCYYPVR